MVKIKFKTLDEMMGSEDYQMYESESLLNPQYHMINKEYGIDVDFMIESNSDGLFGVRHCDFIRCWLDYLKEHYSELDESVYDSIEKEIYAIEEWHEKNETLYSYI